MTDVKIKYKRKPTPFKNAVMWVSLTCNAFLFTGAYAIYTGQLSRDTQTQEVALYSDNWAETLQRGRK
jgi:hypothetical protein